MACFGESPESYWRHLLWLPSRSSRKTPRAANPCWNSLGPNNQTSGRDDKLKKFARRLEDRSPGSGLTSALRASAICGTAMRSATASPVPRISGIAVAALAAHRGCGGGCGHQRCHDFSGAEQRRAGIRPLILDRRRAALLGSTAASTALLQFELDTPLTKLSASVGRRKAEQVWIASRNAVNELRTRSHRLWHSGPLQEPPFLVPGRQCSRRRGTSA